MSTVKGSWATTKVMCGNHGNDECIEMVVQEGPHSLFYACPKYHPDQREENERPCFNRINLIEYESMLSHIADKIIEADENGEVLDLTNYKWEKKGIQYEVLEYSNDKAVIKILNKKSLAQK